ncbi:hypothetical protein RJ55_08680 [Drechmeria coniospora]|nr:hypothetical protein RJ55_08680 [Drechmeria coniospora]
MNLLGNSLKYTEEGFVKVALDKRQDQLLHRQAHHKTQIACITVTDSGRGISQDYLKNSLFVPFTQEDRLSPGVGLGLSLVKKIVSSLRGRIRVQSRVGRGTTISVQIPVEVSDPISPLHPRPDIITEGTGDEFEYQVELLRNIRVYFMGYPKRQPGPMYSEVPENDEQRDEYAILAGICRDWLAMHVMGHHSDVPMTSPEIIICRDYTMKKCIEKHGGKLSAPTAVVICRNMAEVCHMEESCRKLQNSTQVLEFISQPAGPRNLARAIVAVVRRWQCRVDLGTPAELTPPREPDQVLVAASSLPGETGCWRCKVDFDSSKTIYPVAPVTRPQESATTAGEIAGRLPISEKVLIVDDNPINLRILSSFMKSLNQPYDLASNGKEATEKFRENAG